MKKLLAVLFFHFIVTFTFSQYNEGLVFGMKAGVSRSDISGLSEMIVSEDYYSGYQLEEKALIQPAATLFINYRINSSRIGLEGQVSYYQLATDLVYSDVKSFRYTCSFHYHYLGVAGYIKSYMKGGLNIGMGIRFGFNMTPENLRYKSNSDELSWSEGMVPPSDKETRDELRSVIKGRNVTELGVILSYEFDFGLSLDASYHWGLNDMIETMVNRHNFIDSKNHTGFLCLSAGYAITVDKSKKEKHSSR